MYSLRYEHLDYNKIKYYFLHSFYVDIQYSFLQLQLRIVALRFSQRDGFAKSVIAKTF